MTSRENDLLFYGATSCMCSDWLSNIDLLMFKSQLEHDFSSRIHQPKFVEGHLQTNFTSIESLLTDAKLKY